MRMATAVEQLSSAIARGRQLGVLRVYLALSIVIAHAGMSPFFSAGFLSVPAFFVISGFVITMVLVEKYKTDTIQFYIARYMRLWPSYLVVIGVLSLVMPLYRWPLSGDTQALANIATYSMFLYDVLWWVHDAGQGMVFQSSIASDTLSNATRMAHMWSIGVELVFYASAPFVVRRPRFLVGALLLSIAVHICLLVSLSPAHPLNMRSIFGAYWMFALGACGFWVWRSFPQWVNRVPATRLTYVAVLAATIGCIVIGAQTAARSLPLWAGDAFIIAAAGLMVLLFHVSRKSRIDRLIGDVSYPLYLVHWPIVTFVLPELRGQWHGVLGLVAISVGAALALNLACEVPVNRLRAYLWSRKVQRHAATVTATAAT